MIKKWAFRFFASAFILSLVLLSSGNLYNVIQAQTLTVRAYLPVIIGSEHTRYDDFSDEDPVWQSKWSEPKDGSFFYWNGGFISRLNDNSATGIAWPGWRPLTDYKLEVDARFELGRWMNALGLVFGGSDDWTEYYEYLIAYNFAQHWWALGRVEPIERLDYLQGWAGAPAFVHWYGEWNHLTVIRRGDTIRVYCNGNRLGGTFTDGHYGTGRLVGVIVTTFEWNSGEVWFDSFKLTPLSTPF